MRLTKLVVVVGLALAGCGGPDEPVIDPGDGGQYSVALDPADFVADIDNPWMPFIQGHRWLYRVDGGQRIEVVVTHQTRTILGITATVVRDTETQGGQPVEDTFDWYAQDRDGNVWYLGEDTKEYKNGQVVSTAGSWEAGVDGALAGVIMRADPRVGDAYRQEYDRGQAEDMAKVLRTGASERVPFRTFEGLLVTQEWSPFGAQGGGGEVLRQGIRPVLEKTVRGGLGRTELLSYQAAP